VRAPIAAGWIRGIETAAAEAAPGVLGVVTPEHAPTLGPGTDPSGAPRLVPRLQDDRIVHYGQRVGVVVAETAQQATAAARLVEVDYVATEAVLDLDDPRPEVLADPSGLDHQPRRRRRRAGVRRCARRGDLHDSGPDA
jgi:CO/xanthine dehydrogenase Mo-binding subunit